MKKSVFILLAAGCFFLSSCDFFKTKDENYIEIPEGITDEQLQEQRYTYKRDISYKEKFLHQSKADSAVVTIYNVINYQVKDETENISDGFSYYIFDLSVDNFTGQPFNIAGFTRSCYLSNSDATFAYSNVGYALKMYFLQSDSTELDMPYLSKFFQETMPAKEFYRTKIFAYEVSKQDKEPLIFHYRIGNQKFEYQIRAKQY
jgi:hypothetical protein